MRLHSTISAVVLSTVLMASCQPCDPVKGAGNTLKKEIVVAPFTALALQGDMEVRLSKAGTQRITVEAQGNLVDLVETAVADGNWTIRTSKCYRTDKPFIIHVAVPHLERIVIQGSGDIISTDTFEAPALDLTVQGSGDLSVGVKARTVTAHVQGSGDLKLSGSCEELIASVQGSGDIRAGNLKAINAKASIQGSGDIAVDVSGNLEARVMGSGDVKYRTAPASLDQKVTGSGSVRPSK